MQEVISEAIGISVLLIPFVMTVVQLLKKTGVDNKWLPLISMMFGIIVGIGFAMALGESAFVYGVAGFMSGASSSGVYDGWQAVNGERWRNKK